MFLLYSLFYVRLYLIAQFWSVTFQPEYKIADPICTYVFSLLVAFTTFRIIWDTIVIILEGKISLSYPQCGFLTALNHIGGGGHSRVRVMSFLFFTDAYWAMVKPLHVYITYKN